MKLAQITRYPFKSLQGEVLASAEIESDGLRGDRCWGIRDAITGKVLNGQGAGTAVRECSLVAPTAASCDTAHRREVSRARADRCGALGVARQAGTPRELERRACRGAEYFADATDDESEAIEWTMPADRFVDALPLLVLTSSSLRTAGALYPAGDWQPAGSVRTSWWTSRATGGRGRLVRGDDRSHRCR
jgi:hypothetical protein